MEGAIAPQATSNEVAGEATSVSYAGRWRRIAAYLLDTLLALAVIVFVSAWIIRALVVGSTGASGPQAEVGIDFVSMWNTMGSGWKMIVTLAMLVTYGPLYFALMESSPWQATFCKRWLRIYVATHGLQRMNPGLALWRSFVKGLFSLWFLPLFQLIPFLATKRRKAIHDFAANTVVLSGRPDDNFEAWRPLVGFGLSIAGLVLTFVALLRV